ncbi:MAG TPA: hypothetical protein VGH42_11995, partial [Verrucomicrobiae bacterium]
MKKLISRRSRGDDLPRLCASTAGTQTSIPASGFNSIRAFSRRLLLCVGFIAMLSLLHAQEAAPVSGGADSTVDWSSASDLEVELKAVESLPATPADS